MVEQIKQEIEEVFELIIMNKFIKFKLSDGIILFLLFSLYAVKSCQVASHYSPTNFIPIIDIPIMFLCGRVFIWYLCRINNREEIIHK